MNSRGGDPAVYVDALFGGRAMLLDLGDLSVLPPRKLLRVDHAFVSHTHVDHFFGFDRLLRLLIGQKKTVRLYGPPGFTERVCHKLQGYEWNLAPGYEFDLVFDVLELTTPDSATATRFRLKNAFAPENCPAPAVTDGVIYRDALLNVSAAMLQHRNTISLAFAIGEAQHVNVWKNRLTELGLPVGPWLNGLKRAVLEQRPPDTAIATGFEDRPTVPLSELATAVTITPGQKIGYVTDVADTEANRAAIVELVRGADILFIEAVFLAADRDLSRERGHLSTLAAGEIARMAGARRVEPFHISARYAGEEQRLIDEVRAVFGGDVGEASAAA